MDASIETNIALTTLNRFLKGPFINDRYHIQDAEKYIDMLKVKTTGRNQIVKRLSGGNQQKIVVGKWLSTNPKILITVSYTHLDVYKRQLWQKVYQI